MRTQTISAVCLLLTGLAVGLYFSPVRLTTAPEGDLMPRDRVVEAGMNMEVDLRIRNRPLGSRIEWHADKGRFNPEVTETDLRSIFTAPPQQGRVKVWVEIVERNNVYKDVAFAYLDVSRSAPGAPVESSAASLPGGAVVSGPRATSGFVIKFITIPPYDSKGGPTSSADIEGQVEGVKDGEQYRVILYAKTDNTWWVQPLTAAPYTPLDRNGQFFSWTHTGTRYAALLVRKGFVAPEAIDGELPSNKDILAQKEVNGKRKGE
jgi:hypothetical protein